MAEHAEARAIDRRRVVLRFLLGGALLAGLTYWAEPPLHTLWRADPLLVLAATACSLGALACWFEGFARSVRTVAPGASRPTLLRAYLASTFARNVGPTGTVSGVAVGAYVAARDTDVDGARLLGAVAVLEAVSVATSALAAATGLAVTLALAATPADGLLEVGALAGAVLLFTVGGAGVLVHRERWVASATLRATDLVRWPIERVWPALGRRFSRSVIADRIETVLAAVRIAARDRRTTTAVAVATYAGWLLVGFALALACAALAVPVRPWTAVLVVPVAGLAGILPTPGGLGGVEVALVGLLAGVADTPAAALVAGVLLFRVVTFWLHLALGALGLLAGPRWWGTSASDPG